MLLFTLVGSIQYEDSDVLGVYDHPAAVIAAYNAHKMDVWAGEPDQIAFDFYTIIVSRLNAPADETRCYGAVEFSNRYENDTDNLCLELAK